VSYVRSLRKLLEAKDSKLHDRLSSIEEKAESLLTYTAGKFPYYTPHDFVTHSRNVEENLNWIIDDDVKEKLNPHEIFFLLVAAWLHDWGMIGEKGEDPKEIRATHNLRTERYIEKLHDTVNLSSHEGRIVGKICRGHTKEDLQHDYYADIIFGTNIEVRIRFLTACLRIADECDVASNRTPEIIYYSLNPVDKAEEEFQKHLCISGIGRPKAERHKIQLFGIAWAPKGVKVLEQVRGKIQRKLDNVKVFLAQQGVVIDYVELITDTRGFINKPIEFVLDRKKIVELLIGSHLYSRTDCAIRELLQNAVDTCRLKKLITRDYVPSIKVCFGKEKISVEDNGLGMNYAGASRFLSKKGFSFYVSKELEELLGGKDFVPISKFGIGVLSCFLIASKVIIESNKLGSSPCRFVIENLAEGWRYEEGSSTTEGTRITLILNEEGKKIDVKNALSHYAKKIEIPITLVHEDTGDSELHQQQWDASMPEVRENTIIEPDISVPDISDEVVLSQTIYGDGFEATYFRLRKDSHLYMREKNCFLSYRGIYIGSFTFFPTVIVSGWFVLINCTKDLVDIAVSRENLIRNKKSEEFLRLLYDSLLKFIEGIATKGQEKVPYDFEYCVRYSKIVGEYFYDRFVMALGPVTSEIFLKLELEKTHPVLHSKGLKFMKGRDILSDQGIKKIRHYLLPQEESEHHMNSILPFLRVLTKEEVVVFDMGPYFSLTDPAENRTKSVLAILSERKGISLENSDLFKILRNLPLKKVSTPLDALLPGYSSFVEMPKEFRSFVIQKKPYQFKACSKTEALDYTIYGNLLGKELYVNEPAIVRAFDKELEEVRTKFKKIGDGEFLYDINDPLLKLLVEKAQMVLSDISLRILVRSYLRHLAFYSVIVPTENASWAFLWSIENVIFQALGQEGEYKTLLERIGKMSNALQTYRYIPSEGIHKWMYSS